MSKERIVETAAETAKKIRKTLKQAFPGVKFSVRSDTYSMGSSVHVRWTDGPLQEDVDAILNRFKSGSFDILQDMYTTTGYEWDGKIVIGAQYISSSRGLSPERRAIIEEKLRSEYTPDSWGYYSKRDWADAERKLIAAGKLQGFPSQLPAPEATADPEEAGTGADPVPTAPIGGKVIAFPFQAVRDPIKAAEMQAERILKSLTPEQRLKLIMLQTMFGVDEVAKQIISGISVDQLFRLAADRFFGGGAHGN